MPWKLDVNAAEFVPQARAVDHYSGARAGPGLASGESAVLPTGDPSFGCRGPDPAQNPLQTRSATDEWDIQGQTLCALEVAAVSGFVDIREMQISCLGLCNACRDGVPMSCLPIKPGAPSGLLRMVCSGIHEAEGDSSVSRVLPHRRVLIVELTFSDFGSVVQDEWAGQQQGKGWGDGATVDINKVTWPEGTQSIVLKSFNRSVEEVVWPASLERLAFGHGIFVSDRRPSVTMDAFDQPLDAVRFLSGVREIYLGGVFDQPIDNVAWPEGLEKLSLPTFNHPIDKVRWPAGLNTLEFMSPWVVAEAIKMKARSYPDLEEDFRESFNQPINVGLPASLHTLWLSDQFNQRVDAVVWPTGLATIGFGERFNYSLAGAVWPSTLRRVFLVRRPLGYEDRDVPHDCEVFVGVDSDTDTDEYFEEVLEMHWGDRFASDDEPFDGCSSNSDFAM